MIHGFRWIETGKRVWQLEGPARSRRFHGIVSDHGSHITFSLPGGYTVVRTYGDVRYEEHGSGERATVREAKDEVEKVVKAQLPTPLAKRSVVAPALESTTA